MDRKQRYRIDVVRAGRVVACHTPKLQVDAASGLLFAECPDGTRLYGLRESEVAERYAWHVLRQQQRPGVYRVRINGIPLFKKEAL